MSTENHSTLELSVIRRLVKDAIALNYTVSVYDGEEWTVKRSTKLAQVIAAVRTTDDDILQFRAADGTKIGNVFLVYGNMPYEVICDHSDNPAIDALLAGANALANRIEERIG